jgi:hypothetical protein
MTAKANCAVSIIMAYQPCEVRGTPKGKFTVHAQQSSLLCQKYMDDPKPNPRKYSRQDLTKFLKQLKAKGNDLSVMGDFNKVLGSDPTGMSKLCRELVLLDEMKMRHDTSNEPATYACGTKQLDYILMSERCAVSIRKCGYDPLNHHLFSEHRDMFVDMVMEMLFGNLDNVLAAMQYRDVKSRDPKAVSDYLLAVNTYLTNHNFRERLQCLKDTIGEDHELAASLDKDLTRACLTASKQCKKMQQTPWLPKVIQARNLVNILKRLLGMYRTHVDMKKSIAKLQSKAGH